MASLRALLDNFAGALAYATTHMPDNYPDWFIDGYVTQKADLRDTWTAIQTRLKHTSPEQIAFISERLEAAFTAYEAGDNETGERALFDIYNLDVETLH